MPAGLDLDALGPVDVALIVFPGSTFNGDVAPALAELQSAGTIRIIDLAFVHKADDGALTILELEDADIAERLAVLGMVLGVDERIDLLSEEDILLEAAQLAPGSSALILVWENSWAGRFAQAVRESNGTVLAIDRIPHDLVAAAAAVVDEELTAP